MAAEIDCTEQLKPPFCKVHQRHRSNSDPETTARALAQLKIEENKSNGTMRSGSLVNHRHSTTPPPVRKSRFAALGKLFKPWKWKRKKKSDKFEQASRALERKISVRATRDELIKKGVLLPESQSNLSSVCEEPPIMSMSTNSLPNGTFSNENGLSENTVMSYSSPFLMGNGLTENNNTETASNVHSFHENDKANGLASFTCSIPSSQSMSQQHSQLELTLSSLPDPPIAVTEIGPIPPPPMFSCPSLVVPSSTSSQNVTDTTQSFTNSVVPTLSVSSNSEEEDNDGGGDHDDEDDKTETQQQTISYHSDESSESEESPAKQFALIAQNNPSIDHTLFDVIPVKEPSLSSIPRKSALKKKVDFPVNTSFSTSTPSPALPKHQDSNLTRPFRIPVVPNEAPSPPPRVSTRVTRFDVSNKENRPVVLRFTHRDEDTDSDDEPQDEQSRLAAKIARRDSLALKLAQRPHIQELIDKNILPTQSELERQCHREAVGKRLIRRLSERPTAEELEQRNILKQLTPEEFREEKEQKKRLLLRKLSFRPTVEELKERKIIRFNDYIEVTSAHDYDRKADKPWTRLTPRDKATIRKELNEYKSMEMEVHEDSRHLTRFHRP